MRFPVVSETGSGRCTKILQPAFEVHQRGDVLEAAVGERCPVVALAGGAPIDLAMQAVVVVVAGEALQRRLGVRECAEDLAVEDLALERGPKGLDLPVRPRRVDLGADVADLELAQRPAEAREHSRHPVHERRTVVAHEVERPTAQLEAVAQPDQDRRELLRGRDAQAEDEARVVVDQADDPGLEVAAALELDEEWTLDVDVPERVRAAALVAGTALAWPGRPAGAEVVEEALDPPLSDLGDAAAAQLGRDALGVPVRVQAHRDHDLLDPSRVRRRGISRAAPLGPERGQATALVRGLPTEEAGAAAAAQLERRHHALLAHDAHELRALAHRREILAWRHLAPGPSAARCEEAEPRSFLVRTPQPAAVRISGVPVANEDLFRHRTPSSLPRGEDRFDLIHVFTGVSETTGNFT